VTRMRKPNATSFRVARPTSRKGKADSARRHAADLGPVIKAVQAAGVTSLRGIAKALNERGVPTATGKGKWEAMQVGRVLERLAVRSASFEAAEFNAADRGS
jgi:hypothetical protein